MVKSKVKFINLSLLSFISISLFANYKSSETDLATFETDMTTQIDDDLLVKNRSDEDRSNFQNETLSDEEMDQIVDGYNAYTSNNRLYLPRKTGKYLSCMSDIRFSMTYEEFQNVFRKWVRQHPELSIDKWSWDNKYYDGLNLEDIYNYRGDMVATYYSKYRYRCSREIIKKIKVAKRKTFYKHYMRGRKWYNSFIFFTYEDTEMLPDKYPNYYQYKMEVIQKTVYEPETLKYIEYSAFGEWRYPFRMPPRRIGEPRWEIDLSQRQYMLKIADFLKWAFDFTEPNELKFRDVPLKYKISSSDSIGLHLKMWPGVSSLHENKVVPVPQYSISNDRIDCFYFDCKKLVNELRKELIDMLRSEIINEINDNWLAQRLQYLITNDPKVKLKYIVDTFKYLVKNLKGLALKFIKSRITGQSPSVFSLIFSAIKAGKEIIKDLVNEFKELQYLLDIYSELGKYDEAYFDKYKYFFVGVDEGKGFKYNFFDEVNNQNDNTDFVSLQYADNTKINNVDLSKNVYFDNIFGFPRKIMSLETLAKNISSIKNKETYITADYNYKFSDFNV